MEPGLDPLFGQVFPANHLFGDWGGSRTWLENHGIEMDLDNLTENLAGCGDSGAEMALI